MTSVVISSLASRDIDDILDHLEEVAGIPTAKAYATRFEEAILRISQFPSSAPARPLLGDETRIVLVLPYIFIYDDPDGGPVTLLRVLHGRRNITEKLLSQP